MKLPEEAQEPIFEIIEEYPSDVLKNLFATVGVQLTTSQETQREGMALGDQPTEPVATTGPIEKEGADNSGVADDVPMDAEQDSFVINAAAVDEVGELDLEQRIIQPAIDALQKEGIKITVADLKRPQEQVDGSVPVAVSNGEYYIPRALARKIGYGLLKKINDRGKPETEKKLKEREEQKPQEPQAEMQAALGKRIGMSNGDEVIPVPKEKPKNIPDKRLVNKQNVGMALKRLYPDNPVARIVLTAEIDHETGGTFDPLKKQDEGGPGRGLLQFEKGMLRGYNRYIRDKNLLNSVDSQLDFIKGLLDKDPEITKKYHDIGGTNADIINAAFKSENPETAARIFQKRFLKMGRLRKTQREDALKRAIEDSLISDYTESPPSFGSITPDGVDFRGEVVGP